MPKIFIIASESEQLGKLSSELTERGFICSTVPYSAALEHIMEQPTDLVLLNMEGTALNSKTWALPQEIKQEMHIPVISLVTKEMLDNLDSSPSIDDFVVKPWDSSEVVARIKRILRQTNIIGSKDVIKCGDLVIDVPRCQVSLSGEVITLTFREYQLLKFLASNKGKVFTRDALLDKVWGWDFYGGDRTVDVHIRRLRSKIEDRNHSFIDTIRNIGYRFREM